MVEFGIVGAKHRSCLEASGQKTSVVLLFIFHLPKQGVFGTVHFL